MVAPDPSAAPGTELDDADLDEVVGGLERAYVPDSVPRDSTTIDD